MRERERERERVVDALALYACLVMRSPAHRGGKAVNGGVSPFGNERVRYVGSNDDAALNAAMPRFKPDPAAVPALPLTRTTPGVLPCPWSVRMALSMQQCLSKAAKSCASACLLLATANGWCKTLWIQPSIVIGAMPTTHRCSTHC